MSDDTADIIWLVLVVLWLVSPIALLIIAVKSLCRSKDSIGGKAWKTR